MIVTDPIADMLTRIRNALMAKHATVEIPLSKTKLSIAEILVKEGYVASASVVNVGEPRGAYQEQNIVLKLKYTSDNRKVISGLKRISKPGLRIYVNCDKVPKVLNGMGIAIMSTNKGIITDRDARAANVGGEVLAYVW